MKPHWENLFCLACLLAAFGYNCMGKFLTALVFLAIVCVVKHYDKDEIR